MKNFFWTHAWKSLTIKIGISETVLSLAYVNQFSQVQAAGVHFSLDSHSLSTDLNDSECIRGLFVV
jgi:hypothetical protein